MQLFTGKIGGQPDTGPVFLTVGDSVLIRKKQNGIRGVKWNGEIVQTDPGTKIAMKVIDNTNQYGVPVSYNTSLLC